MAELSLEERVELLHSECSELKRKLNEKEFIFEAETDDFKKEISNQQRTINELHKTVKDLNRELKECVSVDKYKKLETTLEEECQRYENLVSVNERYTKMYSSKSEECESLLKELASKDEMIEGCKLSIKSMASSLERYSTLEEELSKTKHDLNEIEKERTDLLQEIDSLRTSVAYFEEMRHKSINESYLFACDESFKFDSPKNRSSCTPESMAVVFDIRFKELEKELEQHKTIVESQENELETLKYEIKLRNNDIDELRAKIFSLDNAVKVSEDEVIRLNSEKMLFEDEIKSLNLQLENYKNATSDYEKCEVDYKSQITDFEVKFSSLIKEKEKSECDLKEQISLLHNELQEWKQLMTVKDAEIQKLDTENYEKKDLLEKSKDSIKLLLEEKEKVEVEALQLQNDLKCVKVEVDSINYSLQKQEQEIETLRSNEKNMLKDLSRSNGEIEYLVGRLQSVDAENQKLKVEISAFEGKIEKKNEEIRKAYKDMSVLSQKWEERTDRYTKKLAEAEAKLKEKTENAEKLNKLVEENKSMYKQLCKAQKEVQNLEEKLKIDEDSFNLERMHKERYRREAEALESELRKYKVQSQHSGNMTFLMPTTVNVSRSEDGAAFLHAIHNSFPNDSVNSSISKKYPPSFAGSFSMADEEGEFMNPKNLSDLKRGVCDMQNEDISGRLSTLQRRNTLMPPHLQSSYPIEMQTISLPTFTEDSMRKGKVVQSNKETSVLRGIENRSFKSMEYIKATYRNGNSEENRQSNVSSHFLLSCTPTKIIKRVKNKHKWTPSKSSCK